MHEQTYDIVPFRADLTDPVVGLLRMLWGEDEAANRSRFAWKYLDNVNTEDPLGIVALDRGEVVGFRGYFGLRFQGPTSDDSLILLLPGDTCVHPHWRRRGLSLAMGRRAMQDYAARYRFFLNMTCSRVSLPGYRKMGFVPLAPKVYLTRCSWPHFLRYLPVARTEVASSSGHARLGNFGRVVVAAEPDPAAMARVACAASREDPRIRPVQDPGFFRWRYRNPGKPYRFYYRVEDGAVVGYVVVGPAPNGQRAYILDYAENRDSALREILQFMIEAKHFLVLSIYAFCLDDALRATLDDLGFKSRSVIRSIEKRRQGELPLMLRPVKERAEEADFFFAGLDTRDIRNWSLKPICSDAV
jgi:GNAT superfamily N-acetyltransferase